MKDTEIAKLKRFLGDKELQNTVKIFLQSKFLTKRSSSDVNTLASQTLAHQMLQEAWEEMERFKVNSETVLEAKNPGV